MLYSFDLFSPNIYITTAVRIVYHLQKPFVADKRVVQKL